MGAKLEREIKLRFDDATSARRAVIAAGALPVAARRLQHDALLDTRDKMLGNHRSALRVRSEEGRAVLTFKGPPHASAMKLREEIETDAGDAGVLLSLFERLGFHVWFRYEKYREEFVKDDVVIAVDETVMGTFVEVEGDEAQVAALAGALGHGPETYVTDSYRGLFMRYCEERGLAMSDMLFDRG
jgi:adenylate cyclase class 2